MSISFPYYAKIKDKYCILYAGYCSEYVLQLKLLRPILENAFPGVVLYLSCRDDFMYLLDGEAKTIARSKLKERKREFAYIRELQTNMKGPHPVHKLFIESKIEVPVMCDRVTNSNQLCCIFSKSSLPTRNMTKCQIESCRNMAQFDGYHVWVDPDVVALDQAGWVIGVEGLPLFEAAFKGIRANLVPTGIGTKFYKALFPKLEVLKMPSPG